MPQPKSFVRPEDPPVDSLPETWVDRYTKWASEQTDAPVQYHTVNGIVVLSALMCPYLFLRTSFGTIKPNIWAMILAGTTLTRKSTSMDMANAMIRDVQPDYLLGTEGSPEGLFAELAERDGKIAMFHRDEITGWMEAILKKDYLAGTIEVFCQLYDGKHVRRVLRGQAYDIDDPNLVIMSGGIKTRMQEILTMEHIRSGFIPRFIMVSGTTKIDEIRPIGPPVDIIHGGRDPREEIVEELYKIVCYYLPGDDPNNKIEINGVVKMSKTQHSVKKELTCTPEVWERIRKLKYDSGKYGENSPNPEIYTPLYDRVSNSVIKIAMLLAGARQSYVVELSDLYKAIHYSDPWLESLSELAAALETAPEMDRWEKRADKVMKFLKEKHPEPVTRTEMMRQFRIKAKDFDDLEKTLIQRGEIRIHKVQNGSTRGKTERTEYVLATQYTTPREGTIVIDAPKKERPTHWTKREEHAHRFPNRDRT